MTADQETAIVIEPPDSAGRQVLVRLPGHIDPTTIAVDFRDSRQGVWTPSDFFNDSVEVRHQ
jgi:hypothetical protein